MKYLFLIFFLTPSLLNAEGLSDETSRFSWDNDFYFFRDTQLSNVFSYQKHLAVNKIDKTAQWHRESWSIQQIMHTPNKETPDNQADKDVPFVGTLIGQKSWYDFDDINFTGYAVSVGVAGPLSIADKTQKLVHSLRGVEVYTGWSRQYPNELIINAHAMKKTKVLQSKYLDLSLGGSLALGNIVTHAGGNIEFRFGSMRPLGFSYVPNSFGFDNHYDANISTSSTVFYGSFTLQSYFVVHNMYLDGSLVQNSPKSYKTPWFGLAILGIHYETSNYGVHLSILASTRNVDKSKAIYAVGNERLGSFTYDWRY